MATAKKLPSGAWRCQVYDHTEEIPQPDGTVKKKIIRKSFTCDDPTAKGKRKCERMAAEWADEKEKRQAAGASITVRDAVQKYCDAKKAVLSPSTIKGYLSIARSQFDEINDLRLSDLTSETVQRWINGIASKKSPKYTKNVYGLLSAIMVEYAPDINIRVTLPQQVRPDLYVPSDADIQALIDYFKESDQDMLLAVYLASYGTLRRSEICGLKSSDITGDVIHVRRALVESDKDGLVEKTTKTYTSKRDIEMPVFCLKSVPRSGKIVNLTPMQITKRFKRAIRVLGLPDFRFHDLRHYSASIMHALGIPDKYIMDRGGWSSDGTLQRVYRNSMDEYTEKFNRRLIEHFEETSHETSHEK